MTDAGNRPTPWRLRHWTRGMLRSDGAQMKRGMWNGVRRRSQSAASSRHRAADRRFCALQHLSLPDTLGSVEP
jgi:hypothetical protein